MTKTPKHLLSLKRQSLARQRQKFPHAQFMYDVLRRLVFPDRISKQRGYCKKCDDAHRPARRANSARWYRANTARVALKVNLRRGRVQAERAVLSIRDQVLISRIYARARELRRWFDVVVDHVIPLAKGGAHSPENLQIIYRVANLEKGARLDYVPSVIFV